MNKADLVNVFVEKGYTTKQSAEIVKTFVDTLFNTLSNGDSVAIRNFGTLSSVRRKPRKYRSIKTGKIVNMKAYRTVKFSISSLLKKSL